LKRIPKGSTVRKNIKIRADLAKLMEREQERQQGHEASYVSENRVYGEAILQYLIAKGHDVAPGPALPLEEERKPGGQTGPRQRGAA
jgi:hypothetical protein